MGHRDQLITRDSFEEMCKALGEPEVFTVPGAHSWMIADPDAFGEIMTNMLEVVRGWRVRIPGTLKLSEPRGGLR